MLDRPQLMQLLREHGADADTDQRDNRNSISSEVSRCRINGRRTAAVAATSSVSVCIGALLDILDMHLQEGATYRGSAVATDEVGLILAERAEPEALDAIAAVLAAQRGGPAVHVHLAHADGTLEAVAPTPVDFAGDKYASAYAGYLTGVEAGAPALLREVCALAGRSELRAYPQMTQVGCWSLRLEGLEVARFKGGTAVLDVGKPGKGGGVSIERAAWQAAVGASPVHVNAADSASVQRAAEMLRTFAAAWMDQPSPAGVKAKQDELALESRILRGVCPVTVSTGPLDLLQGDDGVINWGSQFITRWGRTRNHTPRRLDALLRDGSTPWAIEMKVKGSIGGYYRHAVHQAVLYRHYIRTTPQLDGWFSVHQLDRQACRAAVVIPELNATAHEKNWRARHQRICDLFDVELVEVDTRHALLRSG